MLQQAFEPLTGALCIGALEHFVCRARLPARLPRARVWLRRHTDLALDALGQELTEPVLNGLNVLPMDTVGMVLGAVLLLAFQTLVALALTRARANQGARL